MDTKWDIILQQYQINIEYKKFCKLLEITPKNFSIQKEGNSDKLI